MKITRTKTEDKQVGLSYKEIMKKPGLYKVAGTLTENPIFMVGEENGSGDCLGLLWISGNTICLAKGFTENRFVPYDGIVSFQNG